MLFDRWVVKSIAYRSHHTNSPRTLKTHVHANDVSSDVPMNARTDAGKYERLKIVNE